MAPRPAHTTVTDSHKALLRLRWMTHPSAPCHQSRTCSVWPMAVHPLPRPRKPRCSKVRGEASFGLLSLFTNTLYSFVSKVRYSTELISLQQWSGSRRCSATNTTNVFGGFFRWVPLTSNQVCEPAPDTELLLRLSTVDESSRAARAAPPHDLPDASSARLRCSYFCVSVYVEPSNGFILSDHAANSSPPATGLGALLPATTATG